MRLTENGTLVSIFVIRSSCRRRVRLLVIFQCLLYVVLLSKKRLFARCGSSYLGVWLFAFHALLRQPRKKNTYHASRFFSACSDPEKTWLKMLTYRVSRATMGCILWCSVEVELCVNKLAGLWWESQLCTAAASNACTGVEQGAHWNLSKRSDTKSSTGGY